MNNLKAKGGEFQVLNEQLLGEIEAYGKLKVDYEAALRDVTKELTYSNNITSPLPADKGGARRQAGAGCWRNSLCAPAAEPN